MLFKFMLILFNYVDADIYVEFMLILFNRK